MRISLPKNADGCSIFINSSVLWSLCSLGLRPSSVSQNWRSTQISHGREFSRKYRLRPNPTFIVQYLEKIIRPRTRTVHIGVRRYTYNVVGTEYQYGRPPRSMHELVAGLGFIQLTPVRDIKDIGFLLSVQIAM